MQLKTTYSKSQMTFDPSKTDTDQHISSNLGGDDAVCPTPKTPPSQCSQTSVSAQQQRETRSRTLFA